MATDVPMHPAVPLTRVGGTIGTVEQDSTAEVQQCARAILRTRRGHRIEDVELGVDDPLWRAGVDVDAIGEVLAEHEPRADWQPIERDGRTIGVRIVGVRG